MKGFSPCDEQRVTPEEDTLRQCPMAARGAACTQESTRRLHHYKKQQHQISGVRDSVKAPRRTSSGLPLNDWAKLILSQIDHDLTQRLSCRMEVPVGKMP